MTKDIIVSGVGGQGILTISAIIDLAAMHNGMKVKQAEVHGMSQRGGAVQSHLRISDQEIFSDLIPMGMADLILSVEPMEALRYLPYLKEGGKIITATEPFKNISNYPNEDQIMDTLRKSGDVILVDAAKLAREAGNAKAYNTVMLGTASPYVGLPQEMLEQSISELFKSKGEKVVEVNLKAFKLGLDCC